MEEDGMGRLLDQAIGYAVEKHSGQKRKGRDVPWIVHPLEVMTMLSAMGADEELMAAGVLHDITEDTDASLDEIEELFGKNVRRLVASHLHDPAKTWKENRNNIVESLKDADRDVKMLIMADKISSLRDLSREYRTAGDAVWNRYGAPREMISWYYSACQDQMWDLQKDEKTAPFYWEYVNLYKDMFVRYYLHIDADPERNYLLQTSMHGEAYQFLFAKREWVDENDIIQGDLLEPISRKWAEYIEDSLKKPSVIPEMMN